MLYSDFSDSRQISLFEISSWSVVSHTTHITGLFLHCKRLFYADHKDSAFNFSMMIHCKALLTVSVSTNEITSTGKNQLIQYPELTYLAIIASQQDWKIHLHWVNHVWTDRIGIEPIIAVLETVVLPIKLSSYGGIGNRTQTIRVKVWCSAIELLPNKAADRSRTGNLLIRNQLLYPIELWQQIVNAVFMWFTTRECDGC